MPIFDTTAYAEALKIRYGERIVKQHSDKMVALDLFGESTNEWEGLRVEFPIQVGRNQGVMAMGSLGLLPVPQNLDFQSVQIPVRWVRGRVLFEVGLMKQSLRSSGAFARANDYLMNNLVVDLADERNRMLASGTGRGILALVDDTDGSTAGVLNVDSPGGIASDVYGSRYIQPDMILAFVNPSNSVIRSVRKATAVTNGTTASITLDNDVTTAQAANNDWIVRVSNANVTTAGASSSLDNEPMGLEGIVDDGTNVTTFHNVNRTTVPQWQSTVLSVTALGLEPLQRLEDTIDQTSGETPTHHYMHHSVRRAYLAAADATRVFMQTGKGPQSFDIGQEPMGMDLTYNGRPIRVDRDAQLGEWLMLNSNHLTHYILVRGEWAEETGSMFRAVPGQDALEAIYRVADNFSSDKPNSMGKLTGLSTTNAIARTVD